MAVINNDPCGIICVNKPQGFTSFDVIAKMRGILKQKRLGHAGTLDPMATGVLPVFVGTATKACDMLPDHDKVYKAGFTLGVVTDTQDCSGTVIDRKECSVSLSELINAAEGFKGDIMQIPPMYSAVSVGGKRLYELAREGKSVEREPRKITVYSLDVLSYDENTCSGFLEISCSKGTYIRTLINDIGDSLGCGGIMTSLVRTCACGFGIEECVTLEMLEQSAQGDRDFGKYIMPIEKVFGYLPKVRLSAAQEKMYRNGIRLDINRLCIDNINAAQHAVFGSEGNFIGTAVIMRNEELLKVEKNFF